MPQLTKLYLLFFMDCVIFLISFYTLCMNSAAESIILLHIGIPQEIIRFLENRLFYVK